MNDRYSDRLSEYLDGELSPVEREEVELHLATCGGCAHTLAELRAVVRQARTLEDAPPPPVLWDRIAAGIGAAPAAVETSGGDAASQQESDGVIALDSRRIQPKRRVSFSVPQLAAAAVVLVTLSAGAMYMVIGEQTRLVPVAVQGGTDMRNAEAVAVNLTADAAYDRAVEDLERVLTANGGRLNPKTVDALEQNLQIIDRAIGDAREALARDPASEYLNTYLADRMQRKLTILRDAASMVRAET